MQGCRGNPLDRWQGASSPSSPQSSAISSRTPRIRWADGVARVWDLKQGACSKLGSLGSIRGMIPLSDGRYLLWGYDDLSLWDGLSSEPSAVFSGHSATIKGAVELPGGRILSWCRSGTLCVWDGVSGAQLAVLSGSDESLRWATGLPDGRIISWHWQSVCLWNSHTGACEDVIDMEEAQSSPIFHLAFCESGEGIVTGTSGCSARWGGVLATIGTQAVAWHADADWQVHALMPCGTILASSGSRFEVLHLYHGGERAPLADAYP